MADNFKTNLNISCHLVPVEVPMFFSISSARLSCSPHQNVLRPTE